PFLSEYSAILQEAENLAQQAGIDPLELDTEKCCHAYFEMELIEAVHISHTLNRQLNREQRLTAMERAGEASCRLRKRQKAEGGTSEEAARQLAASHTLSCPLLVDQACLLHANRPLRCRSGLDMETQNRLNEAIQATSRDIFLALTGEFPPTGSLRFTIFDTVSGRFVQQYFQAMIKDSQG
ncbi:MAG: hypothetical protein KJ985_01155, partial [Proteobacteria bacterium]|nr:hypothetical protein [Pseudomonadota bacterium]